MTSKVQKKTLSLACKVSQVLEVLGAFQLEVFLKYFLQIFFVTNPIGLRVEKTTSFMKNVQVNFHIPYPLQFCTLRSS